MFPSGRHFLALLSLSFLLISHSAFSQTPNPSSQGNDPAKPALPAARTSGNPVNPDEYLSDYVDDKEPIFGLHKEATDIDHSFAIQKDVVVVQGSASTGKSMAFKQWYRMQTNADVKILNFSKVIRNKNVLELPGTLQAIADHIAMLNAKSQSRKTYLYVPRLEDFGDQAKLLLESVVRAHTPTIAESGEGAVTKFVTGEGGPGDRAAVISPSNLDKAKLEAFIKNYTNQVIKEYQGKYGWTMETPDFYVSEVERIISNFLPDHLVRNSKMLIDRLIYNLYNEQYLQKGQVAIWRDELNKVNSELEWGPSEKYSQDQKQELEAKRNKLALNIAETRGTRVLSEAELKEAKDSKLIVENSLRKMEPSANPISSFKNKFASSANAFSNWVKGNRETVEDLKSITKGELQAKLETLNAKIASLEAELGRSGDGESTTHQMSKTTIAMAASETFDLPMRMLTMDTDELLKYIEKLVTIYGQEEAMSRLAQLMRQVRSGEAEKGFAVVIQTGESAVGKTNSLEQLAEIAGWGRLYEAMDYYGSETKETDIDGVGKGYVGWAARQKDVLFARFAAQPLFSIFILDEWEKMKETFTKKFITLFGSGVAERFNLNLRGKLIGITTNEGRDFNELLDQAIAIKQSLNGQGELPPDFKIDIPKELNGMLGDPKTSLPVRRQAQLDAILAKIGSTPQQLEQLMEAKGATRFNLLGRANGRYLTKISDVRWPAEFVGRCVVIPFKSHNDETVELSTEKFFLEFRDKMWKSRGLRVYGTKEAIELIRGAFDRTTGVRPLKINLMSFFADAIDMMADKIIVNESAVIIAADNGNFKAELAPLDKLSEQIKIESAKYRQMAAKGELTPLDNPRRRLMNGIIEEGVREAVRYGR